MAARRFEYSDGKSNKFWEIELKGTDVVTSYGRIGGTAQSTTKGFKSAADAVKAHDKLVAEKVGKGYMETGSSAGKGAAKPAKQSAAKPDAKDAGDSAEGPRKSASHRVAPSRPGSATASKQAQASAAAPAGKREFHFSSGSSHKFWAIEFKGKAFEVTFGRQGSDGTKQVKEFDSPEKARAQGEKLIQEKTAKGYVEVGGASSQPAAIQAAPADGSPGQLSPMMFYTTRDGEFTTLSNFLGQRVSDYRGGKGAAGKSVFRIRVSYDEEGEEGEPDYNQRLSDFLGCPAAAKATGLILGSYDLEGGSSGDFGVPQVINAAGSLPNLAALFIGDIVQEECEVSWIQHGDYTRLLAAFPRLEMLRIRGSAGLKIGPAKHARLRALAIETGGLSKDVVSQVLRSDFPALEHLELWLGTPDYEGDCRVNDLQPLLAGKVFPKLTYLGLRNCEIIDELAAVIASSPIVDRLATLDLSLGNMGDEGAKALLQLAAKTQLRRLDLHHHYISKPLQKQLKQLPFPVDLSDSKTAEEDDDIDGRFISVSE